MLWFADRELYFPERWIGRYPGKELAKFFEWVGLQLGEVWIHVVVGVYNERLIIRGIARWRIG